MKRFLSLSAFAIFASAGSSQAVLVVANFGDLTTGTISGKAGGTGFTGSWTGSANPAVATGNLTSTLYSVPQSGTALSVIGTNPGTRQVFRTLAASPTGEVWFSFLAQTSIGAGGATKTDSAGISFNSPTVTPFNDKGSYFLNFTGTDVSYNFGSGTATTVTGITSSGATNLVVGRLVINPGATTDTVTIWINPDLVANPDINAYAPLYNSSANNIFDTISHIGLIAFRSSDTDSPAPGGRVDHIRISDGGGNAVQAYYDVALVPEPSAAVLGMGGLVMGAFLRRRK